MSILKIIDNEKNEVRSIHYSFNKHALSTYYLLEQGYNGQQADKLLVLLWSPQCWGAGRQIWTQNYGV